MILVDANLLIYAVDSGSVHHAAARKWLEDTLSGSERVGFAWVVLLAFLRITTHPSIVRRPLSVERALGYVDGWLRQPFAEPVAPRENHWAVLRVLLAATGSAGNLTSDAHLAALALEHGALICSTDQDFRRFPGLRVKNPLL
ncbi:MAG: type II toxin-antitoxin system VapC family toxin [Acidobacteriota bacterium]